jgi:site-specific DNA-methyltransferase (adenine-specific)
MIIDSTKAPMTQNHCYQQCFLSDNLDLMKTIESNTIDLIYCDILYGTGRNFGDYQDLKPIRSEIESHYIPRIKEMHRILKPTGSIYLQMDTKINHWIRCLMDDIFGYNNLLAEIIWYYDNGGGRRRTFVNKKHDVIIAYSKTNIFTYNEILEPYKETSGYAKGGIVNNGKKYMPNENGKNADDVWCMPILNPMSNERLGYDTQKPKALIERIIRASSKEGDLVADFYMGSGTTAEVCKDLNRNFIGCDINPRAVEITLQRLNNAQS